MIRSVEERMARSGLVVLGFPRHAVAQQHFQAGDQPLGLLDG